MQVQVNGTVLWFDVDGPSLVPGGRQMHERPTVVLLHGGPGSYDHSYLKPYFSEHLASVAQVIYLDLRGHGRSARGEPTEWTFETWADDVRAFCDALGIAAPVVYGHSMGGFVAMLYGARHPGHAGALVLQSTTARFDVPRLVAEVRRLGGDEVGDLAQRSYGGQEVTDAEWARVFAAFGPAVPDADELARRTQNPESGRSSVASSPRSMWLASSTTSRRRPSWLSAILIRSHRWRRQGRSSTPCRLASAGLRCSKAPATSRGSMPRTRTGP